ncbi:MAG: cell division FtsZ family protein [Verrucomicrobiaceae bacterium]|nr:cell division FtsZ family protein [Verrucomicrobiaceae bacterium]
MVEYHRSNHGDGSTAALSAPRICIVGVGGSGSNVIDRITLDRIVDATLVCMHTDVRVLGHSMAPVKVQLGVEIMKGIGAGGDPDLGREAALFSREQIRQSIDGHDIIFISAGLGGGSGSGAAPVIAEIAKNTGALVIVVATMPFSFEGRRRLGQAEEALELLQKRCDALILFENNRMGELVLPKDGIQKAFTQADQLIAQALRAVSTITATPGIVKLGLDDLTSALRTANGRCLFGFGEARGQNRGTEAVKKALKSPLIDQGRLLSHTQTLLVHVAGGESLTLIEVEGIMKSLGKYVPDSTHMLFGLAVNPKLGDSVAVTLISSLGLTQLNAHAAAAPPAEMMPTAPAKREKRLTTPPPPPAPVNDLLFREEEIVPPAPEPEIIEKVENREEPAPEPEMEEIAPEPEITAPEAEIEPEMADEEPEEAYTPPPAPPAPVITARESKPLATVVSRTVTLQTDPPPVQDDMLVFEDAPAAPAPKPAPASRRTIAIEQPSLDLTTEQDRGRFKDTEPSVVEGEDLDVPTWKRIKMKLKR